ncbi:MAG: hypothetical protein EOP18_00555, partial [Rhizobiaceae bacterium]
MRLTIKAKLVATFCVVVALSAGSMLVAIQNLGQLNDSLGLIVNVRTANSLAMAELQTRMESIGSRTRALILTNDDGAVEDYVGKIAADFATAEGDSATLRGNIS